MSGPVSTFRRINSLPTELHQLILEITISTDLVSVPTGASTRAYILSNPHAAQALAPIWERVYKKEMAGARRERIRALMWKVVMALGRGNGEGKERRREKILVWMRRREDAEAAIWGGERWKMGVKNVLGLGERGKRMVSGLRARLEDEMEAVKGAAVTARDGRAIF